MLLCHPLPSLTAHQQEKKRKKGAHIWQVTKSTDFNKKGKKRVQGEETGKNMDPPKQEMEVQETLPDGSEDLRCFSPVQFFPFYNNRTDHCSIVFAWRKLSYHLASRRPDTWTDADLMNVHANQPLSITMKFLQCSILHNETCLC